MDFEAIDTTVPTLGEPRYDSPLIGLEGMEFVDDSRRVLINALAGADGEPVPGTPAFELSGPRRRIFFDPATVRVGMATCGGLCPGLNDVIRAIVMECNHRYGVSDVYGFRYGMEGFLPEYGHPIEHLTPKRVANILDMGGSILGSSRGAQDKGRMVDTLEHMKINVLFMLGGDGTLKGANQIADVVERRKLPISVVGIPKTIDNDIHLCARTFGFETAVNIAVQAIKGAHNEAEGYKNGVGLIKLMGRHSGFIAAATALAQQDVNFVLIPEMDFDLEGPGGFLEALEARLDQRQHAVVVVAEGAGQKFFTDERGHDASGNVKLADIGLYLKERIAAHFKRKDKPLSLKYIDPSYMVRSLPANASDSVFCSLFGRDAVHAAMAGRTRMLVGYWNDRFVHIPMAASVGRRKQVDLKGKLWRSVVASTGQGSLKARG